MMKLCLLSMTKKAYAFFYGKGGWQMEIKEIEFINESDQFFYDKEKQCWVGYVCFNYRYNYYFEIL